MAKFKASSWMSSEGYQSGKQAEAAKDSIRRARTDPDMVFAKICIVIAVLGGLFLTYRLPSIASAVPCNIAPQAHGCR